MAAKVAIIAKQTLGVHIEKSIVVIAASYSETTFSTGFTLKVKLR